MEIVKRIAAADITTASTEQDLYEVPDLKAIAGKVFVCNRNNASITFRLSVSFGGASTVVGDYLYFDETLAANTTKEIKNISASNLDKIRIYASHSDVTFSLFGSEFDQQNVYTP